LESPSPYHVPTKRWALRRAAQVVLARAWERVPLSAPLREGQVPRSVEEIDAEWVTAVVCAQTPGAHVRSVRLLGGSVGTTTRVALEVTYNGVGVDARLPNRLFAKCTIALGQQLTLGLGGLLCGEPNFYKHVRPEVEIEAPLGYYAAVEPRSWRSIVLIEDVSATRGARFWTPADEMGREEVEDLLTNVAAWHGALWNSPRLAHWRWLRTPGDQIRLIDALIGLADRRRVGAQRASAVISPRLRQRQSDLYEGVRRSMQLASRGPHTYLHGDLHIANTYLTSARRLGIVDWQVGLRGSWAFDYGYIMATGLTVDDRRAWERELLHFYLDRLAAAGGEKLPGDIAWEAYRTAMFYPYFAWVYTIGRSRLQPKFQPEQLSLTMIERISTAIDDLGSLTAVGL
jgi:Phosphotransferase enzyme family